MKELIRHILKEETSLPLFVRRRITPQQMRKSFLNALYYVIERFLGKHFVRDFGFLSLDKFKELVISEMMENIHPYTKQYGVLNDPYEDDETYSMISDSLSKHYSDEIEDNYNTFFGKKDINESQETNRKTRMVKIISDLGIQNTIEMVGGFDKFEKIMDINDPMDYLRLYNGMDKVQSKEYERFLLYRFNPKRNIMMVNPLISRVYINEDEIWRILRREFDLNNDEARYTVERWLKEEYNIETHVLIVATSLDYY